jgi:glycine/sarcosine N-methyltransferase
VTVAEEVSLYDALSDDYDRFVNWESRLAYEMPFIERTLREADARRVVDVACGTGMHAIELARNGYKVVGADLSAPMIERARENISAAGVEARFVVAGFGELAEKLALKVKGGSSQFDAVLCLGNSLPHVPSAGDLGDALADFAAVLRPGGVLLIQNRNFDAVMDHRERWMEPQAHREGETEWLFLRFYDFELEDTLTFNLVTLRREGAGAWSQRVTSTRLWPLRQEELTAAMVEAGFGSIACYGDMAGLPFAPGSSPNLIVTAQRTV